MTGQANLFVDATAVQLAHDLGGCKAAFAAAGLGEDFVRHVLRGSMNRARGYYLWDGKRLKFQHDHRERSTRENDATRNYLRETGGVLGGGVLVMLRFSQNGVEDDGREAWFEIICWYCLCSTGHLRR